jgi:hypothetical protein
MLGKCKENMPELYVVRILYTVANPRPEQYMEDNIKTGLREIGCNVWIAFIWLRTGTAFGLL